MIASNYILMSPRIIKGSYRGVISIVLFAVALHQGQEQHLYVFHVTHIYALEHMLDGARVFGQSATRPKGLEALGKEYYLACNEKDPDPLTRNTKATQNIWKEGRKQDIV